MADKQIQLIEKRPESYWRIGPLFVHKWVAVLILILAACAVLVLFGFPTGLFPTLSREPPAYHYADRKLADLSGVVRVLDDADRVRYEGGVVQGAYTGQGKVYDTKGQLVYDGPLVEGRYEGADAKVYADTQLIYEGEMADNLYEGQGRRTDPETGIVSDGQFTRGVFEGEGQELYASGTLLREGTFSNNLLEGEGKEYSRDGVLIREGSFSAGLLHGAGLAYTQSGGLLYEGEFYQGLYHGLGTLYNTLLDVPTYEGEFVYGTAAGQGTIYHPSGQLMYVGQVYAQRPRADAFLGMSLSDVESAFTTHWELYTMDGVTAFVYPYFKLMFITESPVSILSPQQQEKQTQQERQEILDLLEEMQPVVIMPGTETDAGTPGQSDTAQDGLAQTMSIARQTSAAPSDDVELTQIDDEILDPETDRGEIIITQVLSYGEHLPGVAQPNLSCSFGMAPVPFNALPTPRVMINGRPAGVMTDTAPTVNIPPFGMCSCMANPTVAAATAAAMGVLTPMPCVPVPTGPWLMPAQKVLIGGRPAISNGSKLMCAWGGQITVQFAGQATVQVK